MKRIKSIALTMILLLSFLMTESLSLSAATPQAKIGEKTYSTLSAAVSAAKSGDCVQLMKNVDMRDDTLWVGKGVTLDLSGYTLRLYSIIISKNSVLTDRSVSTTHSGKLYIPEENFIYNGGKEDGAYHMDYELGESGHGDGVCCFPVYDASLGAYSFYNILAWKTKWDNNTFIFRPIEASMDQAAFQNMLKKNNLQLKVTVQKDAKTTQTYTYAMAEACLSDFAAGDLGTAFTITINGTFRSISVTPYLENKVVLFGKETAR